MVNRSPAGDERGTRPAAPGVDNVVFGTEGGSVVVDVVARSAVGASGVDEADFDASGGGGSLSPAGAGGSTVASDAAATATGGVVGFAGEPGDPGARASGYTSATRGR